MSRSLRAVPHLLVFALGYTLFGIASLPGLFTTRFGISLSAFGLLTSLPLGAFVVAQPIASRLADRRATTRLLLWAALAHTLLTVGLDLAGSFPTLLAMRFAWGVVAGFMLSVGATHIARLDPENTFLQGVYGGMITLGGAVSFLVAGPVVAMTGGVGLHALGAVPALLAAASCWRHRGEARTVPRGGDGPTPPAWVTATNRTVVLVAVVYVAIIGSYVTLSTFVTAFFDDLGVVGPLNALVLAGATAGRIAGGTVGQRSALSDVAIVTGSVAVAVAGFGALAAGPTGLLLLALPFVTMLAVSVPFGSVYNITAGATDAEGTALATVVAAGNVAALVLPPISGALREAFGDYRLAFALLAAVNVAALASAFALARTHDS